MTEQFYIGQEFINEYPQELAIWCIEHQYQVEKIIPEQPDEPIVFKIVELPKPTPEEEAEKIAKLKLTGADVERGIYKAKGMDFEDIIAYVTQLQPEGLDIKALKIELKANNFYRGNPYVNAVGGLLGFTKEQLDEFFETGDYTKLIGS